jgi:Holliday junction resolvasome RuvABC endonuclease subunit
MVLIGLDPGSGVSSPTGCVAYDRDTKQIYFAENCGSKHTKIEHRIQEISKHVGWLVSSVGPEAEGCVYIEHFVMRGKGGETLARLVGSLVSVLPPHFEVRFVNNLQMKLLVGGSGRSDKEQVAAGVLEHFKNSKVIIQMIADKQWDLTDAFGLAIAGQIQGSRE